MMVSIPYSATVAVLVVVAENRVVRWQDRAATAHGADKPAETDGGEEKIAASPEKSSEEEVTRSAAETTQDSNRRAPIQTLTSADPPIQAETARLVPDATALEFTEEVEATEISETAAAVQAAPISAMGITAYKISAHGVGEQEAAANNGLPLQTAPG